MLWWAAAVEQRTGVMYQGITGTDQIRADRSAWFSCLCGKEMKGQKGGEDLYLSARPCSTFYTSTHTLYGI
ncbi:hypothetical protein FIBSPDRAFT_856033 [Athelia psychrophila]|uniref:Uncharacterized protein n=1 Tax=Athelia psychrophila TaxID=1759441 RepID=A0A166NKJ4_9AGAM|nr:hypothetical protein FIBSPDRAFT_856033 [Fibularhizoctonia sp. CBS 109695]